MHDPNIKTFKDLIVDILRDGKLRSRCMTDIVGVLRDGNYQLTMDEQTRIVAFLGSDPERFSADEVSNLVQMASHHTNYAH